MELPERVTQSRLWRGIKRPEFTQILGELRHLAEALAGQVERTVPEYTDHSVKHMDSLWAVADEILSASESAKLNSAEAFILGCGFYVHDLGMALASTPEGVAQIRASEEYVAVHDQLTRSYKLRDPRADQLALRAACRQIHAEKVSSLVSEPLPGVKRFLIENTEAREAWGYLIAEVAASHHWSLDKVHRVLGARNAVPTASGESVDAGYLACLLRVTDYAHINCERASNLARALRSEIGSDSVVHWDAQSHITGPARENDYLVYACTAPIEDVDAWWLFYDLASGLDAEIRSGARVPSRTSYFGRPVLTARRHGG